MNKTQLVDVLAERLGDRRTAATAVEGLLETIVDTVRSGDSVSLTGFGVFEGRPRAARRARNPRTGETVAVPATTVPAFRPGTTFRTAVGGGGAPTRSSAATTEPAEKAAGTAVKTAAKTAAKTAKADSSFTAKGGKAEKAEKATKSEKSKKAAKNGGGKAKSGKTDDKADGKGKKAKAKK